MQRFHIVAVAQNGVIGVQNRLPWHFSEDLKFFKQTTMGETLLMGRKTFESIGRALPGRANLVLTRDPAAYGRSEIFNKAQAAGGDLRLCASYEEAEKLCRTQKLFVMGGEALYRLTLDRMDGLWVTRVGAPYEGDAFYPTIPPQFQITTRQPLRPSTPTLEAIFYSNKSNQI